jgi:hypothetical protein
LDRGGVFLLDSKRLLGAVEVAGDKLTVRRIEDPDLRYFAGIGALGKGDGIRTQPSTLQSASMGPAGGVVTHGRFAAGCQTTNGVAYVDEQHLVTYLRTQPRRVADEQILRIANHIREIYKAGNPSEATTPALMH